MALTVGDFGPLSATLAADLAAIASDIGIPCKMGSINFDAVPEYVGKDILASMGIGGVRGTVIKLNVLTTALPTGPIRNQTPITVNGAAYLVRFSDLEGDGTMTLIYCEAAP